MLELEEIREYLRQMLDKKASEATNDIVSSVNTAKDTLRSTILEEVPRVRNPNVLILDFRDDSDIRYIVNFDEIGAELVNTADEGIPSAYSWTNNHKVLKISLNANETKTLVIRTNFVNWMAGYRVLAYCTGTATVKGNPNAYTYHYPQLKIQNEWKELGGACGYPYTLELQLDGGASGGNIYIAWIEIIPLGAEPGANGIPFYSWLNLSLDGTTTYGPAFAFKWPRTAKFARVIFGLTLNGDGTNAVNATVKIYSRGRYVNVASVAVVSATPITQIVHTNVKLQFNQPNNPYFHGYIEVSGYGNYYGHKIEFVPFDEDYEYFAGKSSASASNASTTAATYTLHDSNGHDDYIINGEISISVPSTGGSASIIINGFTVATYGAGASATFSIPDNIPIYLIQVSLAGDGTNAATASFSGLVKRKVGIVASL